MPSPLPPSLWSDGARRVAAAVALVAVAAIGFGIGYIVFDDSGERGWRTGTDLGGHQSRAGAEQRRDRRLPRVRDPQHD